MADFASIPFFEQTGISGQQTVYSPVFDVAAYGQVVAALKVVAIAGGTKALDCDLQQSMDMDQWATLESFTQASATGVEVKSATKFGRYVRAKIYTTAASTDFTVTFSLLGIAREIG